MKTEEILKELEIIIGLVNDAIQQEAGYQVPIQQSAIDRGELAEAVDPDLQRLLDIRDRLLALYKNVELEAKKRNNA